MATRTTLDTLLLDPCTTLAEVAALHPASQRGAARASLDCRTGRGRTVGVIRGGRADAPQDVADSLGRIGRGKAGG